jgi:hypothetical protein
MSQPSFSCNRTILEYNQGVVNRPFSPGNRTILIAIKDCSVTRRESWTIPSLLVTEQSLSAALNRPFSPGNRTIVERNPYLERTSILSRNRTACRFNWGNREPWDGIVGIQRLDAGTRASHHRTVTGHKDRRVGMCGPLGAESRCEGLQPH